ncbi:MAG: terminase small subunit [Oscillospiraceae bacterium]
MAKNKIENYELAEVDYIDGMSYKNIAQKYNISINTVKSWKTRYKWKRDKKPCTQKSSANIKALKDNIKKTDTIKNTNNKAEKQSTDENIEIVDKQELFCFYYVRSFNATKAYMKAYKVSYESAAPLASKLLRNDKIKKRIAALKQNKLNRELLNENDIVQKYIDIAFADITDFVEFGQEEKPVMAMYGPVMIKDDDTGEKVMLTEMVNVINLKESHEVDGTLISEVKQGRDGASIKLPDRMKALEWLANHMDLATERQRAEIQKLKAEISKLNGEDEDIEDIDDIEDEIYGTKK